ncbi:unnamed protein product [Didymodactylos carnosus]|nr:unnamed protein product [Didymodactylos carnosus]CAF3715085.1 unnamed protein product [Didymodactylos carnosus]
MSIAEQMGRVLQLTAISTNIKERLDFSCAIFGPDGGLVANAPHIPVHLGAMQEAVQFQMRALENNLNDGDVILTNHPAAGGSHLPDFTVITPVFHAENGTPVFFVASRGHHADIGGLTPELTDCLNEPGKLPNCSGTRTLMHNIADLKAQIAANFKDNAETAVRDLLKTVAKKLPEAVDNCLKAKDFMDDGSEIQLCVKIDPDKLTAKFDFTGTSEQVLYNWNTPRAITYSAIIYCLRAMIGHDIPLNQGCMKPVEVVLPKGSLLDPSEDAAVVGGNVLTSQRLVDVILHAFHCCAASQGCMNNITWGDEKASYYETVAGGAGAGPKWHGRSGVHTHMTNTRITDPEILEKRYPVVLLKFCLRKNSGGNGAYNGGDGVERQILFRKKLTLSVLTERRSHRPYGLNGGESGQCGKNTLKRADGRLINMGGKSSVPVEPGDCFILLTPGGGGFGTKTTDDQNTTPSDDEKKAELKNFFEKGSLFDYRMTQEGA